MRPLRKTLIILLLVAPGMLGGCTLANWFVAVFSPPQKVHARYEPAKDKTYLVFVDDLLCPVTYEPIKRELTESLSKQLTEHDIASSTVPYEDLLDLMATNPNFNSMHVPTVGRKLGADMVLYVQIDEFALKDDQASPLWKGLLRVTVKVVDSDAGRLWPPDRPGGYPVPAIETPQTEHPSPAYGAELASILADKAADRIAKLFYEHEVSAHPFGKDSSFGGQ